MKPLWQYYTYAMIFEFVLVEFSLVAGNIPAACCFLVGQISCGVLASLYARRGE